MIEDLKAAVNEYAIGEKYVMVKGARLRQLLALLEAGKACRDELGAPCDDAECGETPCVLVRAYDEAAK